MKLIVAFFKMIRWPNLLFIVLTQCLFYFCVFQKILLSPGLHLTNHIPFYLLVFASILIAAAGYIINDYFDMQIDAINKPQKVVVDKILKRRWAIMWHWILSGIGIIISFYISYKLNNWIIFVANIFCVLLLWFYSTSFKKRILSGNIIIASLTAWVIVVVYFYCSSLLNQLPEFNISFDKNRFFKFTILYAGFAFIISIIREVVKDLEDMEGDALYHCKTMPVVWGVQTSKVFSAVWLVVCIASLVIIQLYAWQLGWWIISAYAIIFIILPLVFILKKLYQANTPVKYHALSTLIKFVMLAGILSMLFFIF